MSHDYAPDVSHKSSYLILATALQAGAVAIPVYIKENSEDEVTVQGHRLSEWQGWTSTLLWPKSIATWTFLLSCPDTKLLDCQSWAPIVSPPWEVQTSPFPLSAELSSGCCISHLSSAFFGKRTPRSPGLPCPLSYLRGWQFVLGGQELNSHVLGRSPSRDPGIGPCLTSHALRG